MAEDDSPDWPGEEADGVRGKSRHRAGERVERREEQFAEDQGGRGAIEEEVVPLDRSADKAGQHHAPDRRRARCPGRFHAAWDFRLHLVPYVIELLKGV